MFAPELQHCRAAQRHALSTVKIASPASTHKKVVVLLSDRTSLRANLNPARLGEAEKVDILTPDREHVPLPLAQIRCIYFVREFPDDFVPDRKALLSRPNLDGVGGRLPFSDAA